MENTNNIKENMDEENLYKKKYKLMREKHNKNVLKYKYKDIEKWNEYAKNYYHQKYANDPVYKEKKRQYYLKRKAEKKLHK